MLGSTSDFVATHTPCSVLVVRPDQGESPTHRNLKLCIADDQSPAAEFAIERLKFGLGGSDAYRPGQCVTFSVILFRAPSNLRFGGVTNGHA